MHWLSEAPAHLRDHVHDVDSQDPKRDDFQQLAQTNWQSILQSRYNELKGNGIFFAVNFCVSPTNTYLGKTTGKSMFSTFAEIWRTLVSEKEFLETNFPQYYRNQEELESQARQMGFEVLEHQVVETACPYKEKFISGEWDAKTFAQNFLPTMTTWSTAVFRDGLADSRSEAEKDQLISELWGEYQRRIELDPESYQMDYVHSFLVLKKS